MADTAVASASRPPRQAGSDIAPNVTNAVINATRRAARVAKMPPAQMMRTRPAASVDTTVGKRQIARLRQAVEFG